MSIVIIPLEELKIVLKEYVSENSKEFLNILKSRGYQVDGDVYFKIDHGK